MGIFVPSRCRVSAAADIRGGGRRALGSLPRDSRVAFDVGGYSPASSPGSVPAVRGPTQCAAAPDPQRTSPVAGERRRTRSACLRSPLFGIATQKAFIDLHGLLRCFTVILDSGSDRDASSAHPDQLARGPRSSVRPNIHDDRNGIFRAGPAPWRSSRLRSSHAWVHAFRFSRPVLHSDPMLTLDVIDSRALFSL
jgi:hypothetical protein